MPKNEFIQFPGIIIIIMLCSSLLHLLMSSNRIERQPVVTSCEQNGSFITDDYYFDQNIWTSQANFSCNVLIPCLYWLIWVSDIKSWTDPRDRKVTIRHHYIVCPCLHTPLSFSLFSLLLSAVTLWSGAASGVNC